MVHCCSHDKREARVNKCRFGTRRAMQPESPAQGWAEHGRLGEVSGEEGHAHAVPSPVPLPEGATVDLAAAGPHRGEAPPACCRAASPSFAHLGSERRGQGHASSKRGRAGGGLANIGVTTLRDERRPSAYELRARSAPQRSWRPSGFRAAREQGEKAVVAHGTVEDSARRLRDRWPDHHVISVGTTVHSVGLFSADLMTHIPWQECWGTRVSTFKAASRKWGKHSRGRVRVRRFRATKARG